MPADDWQGRHAGTRTGSSAPAAAEVLHGYTLGRLQALARIAVRTAWSQAADYTDRLDAAWHGVAAHLAAASVPPQPWDLVIAGRAEVDDTARAEAREHGKAHRERHGARQSEDYGSD